MSELGPLRDVAYVAARLGISEVAVYRYVTLKRIAVVRLGSGEGGRKHALLRFLDADIDAFIAARRAPAIVPAAPIAVAPGPRAVPRRRAARVIDLPGADRFVGGRRAAGGA